VKSKVNEGMIIYSVPTITQINSTEAGNDIEKWASFDDFKNKNFLYCNVKFSHGFNEETWQ